MFQTAGICCTCLCFSSLSSTSILCTRIPLVPRMRLVILPHFYASNFQRKFFKRFRHLPAQSTIETSMDDGIIELGDRRAMGPPETSFSMKCLCRWWLPEKSTCPHGADRTNKTTQRRLPSTTFLRSHAAYVFLRSSTSECASLRHRAPRF